MVGTLAAAPAGALANPVPVVEYSTDTSPCTSTIVAITSPIQARIFQSPRGTNPASVCVTGFGQAHRITVGATGLPPVVTYSTDTSPCTRTVAAITSPIQARIFQSPDGAMPVSLCLTAAGLGHRVTIDPNGMP